MPEQIDIKQEIADLKCQILEKVYKVTNLADCRILLTMLDTKLKGRLYEYSDAHLITWAEACKHIQDVYSVLHDECRRIVKSPAFNN